MLVVGLTGGIASGKSTVSGLIAQHPAGIPVIDLDVLAREVVEPGQPALKKLAATFGSEVVKADGTLDRAQLGRVAFASPAETRKLNAITHGAIRRRMMWLLVKFWLTGHRVVVVDSPLLVEAGMWAWAGQVVLVYCSAEDQLSRMLTRDAAAKGLTEADAKQRLDAQLPLSSKLPYADTILDNTSARAQAESGSASAQLRTQVDRLIEKWLTSFSWRSAPIHTITWLVQWLVPPFGLASGLYAAYATRSRVNERRSTGDTSTTSKL